MLINKKELNCFNNNNIFIFIIKNDIKNIIRRISFISNIFNYITYRFK